MTRAPRLRRPVARIMALSRSLVRLVVGAVLLGGALTVVAFLPSGCTGVVNHFAFHPHRERAPDASSLPAGVRHVTYPTADGETVEGYLVAATTRPERLLLYFHGNAGHIGHRLPELREMASRTGAAVLGSGYRGYGASSGSPSEAGIYRDGEAALRHARESLGFTPAQIILIGRSLGTTVATHLAPRGDDFAGVILVTPLSTGRDFGREHLGAISLMAGRSFDNFGRAPAITEPTLVLHGDADEVIPHAHGRSFFEALAGPKRFVTIAGGRHNDLEFVDARTFWGALAAFAAAPASYVAESTK